MFDTEFFPTPLAVVHKMLGVLDKSARHFLEPSAGKGNIAEVIKNGVHRGKVDCIESNPELAAILQSKGFPVVGFDWLEYSGVCYYDAIVMNPPFSNGDEHLLKAWNFLHSGEIVCLLNEETINNPWTATRKLLASIIEKNGTVEYLGDCFKGSERTTGVNVAMVHLKKVSEDDTVDLWATGKAERDVSADIGDKNMLAIVDKLGNMQHYYDEANEHMFKAFQHIRKASLYMQANDLHLSSGAYEEIVKMAARNVKDARSEFARKHRHDAWLSVFEKMEFRKWLDHKQTESFVRDIEKNGNIPFTKENIKGTLENVFLQRRRLFEQSVANVFDELTRYYKGNSNHTEGWKTNDNYKVNEKLIFPYGVSFDKTFDSFNLWSSYTSINVYNDLDRVLCVLAGTDFAECDTVADALRRAFQAYRNTLETKATSQHFEMRFFKKGTLHLVFRDRHLWQEFNATAAKGRAWLGNDTQAA